MKFGERVTAVEPLEPYRLRLTFTDGTVGTVDLAGQIVGHGGVFGPLNDRAFFRQVTVDREAGTIAWPNGVDLCPDVLYASLEPDQVPPTATRKS